MQKTGNYWNGTLQKIYLNLPNLSQPIFFVKMRLEGFFEISSKDYIIVKNKFIFFNFFQCIIMISFTETSSHKIFCLMLKTLQKLVFKKQKKLLKILKKGDFGVSLKLEKNQSFNNRCAGTYHFMAPESGKTSKFKNLSSSGKDSDIWSLGVTLFCFVFKTVPFDGETVFEILNNIEEKP